MGWQIIEQPDGRFAIWSSVVDSFLWLNLTDEQAVQKFVRRDAARTRKAMRGVIGKLRMKVIPHPMALSFDEAMQTLKDNYGAAYNKEILMKLQRGLPIAL